MGMLLRLHLVCSVYVATISRILIVAVSDGSDKLCLPNSLNLDDCDSGYIAMGWPQERHVGTPGVGLY